MDLATLTQAPSTVDVGGREFRIGPLRYLELGVIQRWLNEHTPDARPAPQVGEGRAWVEALLGPAEGVAFFLSVLFSKHQDFGPDDLAHLLGHVGPRHLGYLFALAMDEDPRAAGEAEEAGGDGPKGGAAPPTSRSSTGRSSRARGGARTGSTS